MNEQDEREALREQLSALIDGELSREQTLFLLRRLEHDAALRDEWERLHQLRDLLNEQPPTAPAGFSARVMAAIEAEPALPLRRQGVATPRWLQTVAGGAVAAGVAYAALLGSTPLAPPAAEQPALATVQPVTAGAGSGATGAMLLPQQVFAPVAQTSGGAGPMLQRNPVELKLDRYLLRHSQALQAGPSLADPYLYPVSFGDRASSATR